MGRAAGVPAAQDLELRPRHQQLDVFDVQTAAAADKRTQNRPASADTDIGAIQGGLLGEYLGLSEKCAAIEAGAVGVLILHDHMGDGLGAAVARGRARHLPDRRRHGLRRRRPARGGAAGHLYVERSFLG